MGNARSVSEVKSILAPLQDSPRKLAVQLEGCEKLLAVTHEKPELSSVIAEAGGIDILISACANHKSIEEIQSYCIGALMNLSHENEANSAQIVEADGIEIIVKALKKFEDSDTIARNGCGALWNLSFDNASNKDQVNADGGIEVIMKCMNTFVDDCMVIANAIGALMSLTANNEDIQQKVIDNGGVGVIISMLKKYRTDADVVRRCCGALTNLSEERPDLKTQMVGDSMIDLITDCFGDFMEDVSVVEMLVMSLMNFASENHCCQKIVDLGGIEATIAAMETHVEEEKVNAWACGVLMTLAEDNAEFMKKILEEGGIEVIQGALEKHLDSENVQQYGTKALELLEDAKDSVKKAGKFQTKAGKLVEEGKINEAIESYSKAITAYGDSVAYKCYLDRSTAYICADQLDNALEDIASALKLKEDCREAILKQAQLTQLTGKLSEAAKIYKKAMVTFPNNANIHLGNKLLQSQIKAKDLSATAKKGGWLY